MILTYLIALILVLSVFFIMLSIPSMINIFILGYKEYFKRFKLLLTLYRKLNVSFVVKEVKYYSYQYNNGAPPKQISRIESGYYFPIYLSYTNLILVRKGEYMFYIQECIEVNDKWESNMPEFKLKSCIFGTMLYDLIDRKIEKLSKNAIEISNIDELNTYLNSELTSIKRETKLKNLLNE